MLVRFGHCCNPVPGDEIAGYITRGRGVTVHKADCVNILNCEPERRINVSWADEDMGAFSARLRIIAYDRPGLLGEITVYVSDAGAPVTAVSGRLNKNGTCIILMVVKVSSKEQLNQVLLKIRKRPDVIEAHRTAG